jgi:PTS HPr component phosphorylation site
VDRIAKDDEARVNARSMPGLLTLGAEYGDLVTLHAEAHGADAALDGPPRQWSANSTSERISPPPISMPPIVLVL